MAANKRMVNQNNYLHIICYFRRAIQTYRIDDDYFYDEAKPAFEKIRRHELKTNEIIKAIQQWVNQYLTDKQWQCCLAALRKSKHKLRHRPKSLSVNTDVYYRLQYFSEERNISISNAIDQLITQAEDANN